MDTARLPGSVVPPRRRFRGAVPAVLLFGLAVAALGCGGGAASAPTSSAAATSSTVAGPGAAYAWLANRAEPSNHALNRDQRSVLAAAGAVTGVSSSQFFARLKAACSTMLADTRKAQAVPHAPSTSLEQAWSGMLARTATYASDCITLTHNHGAQDLTTWNDSLAPMNQASTVWNAAVNATRNGPH